MNMKKLIIGVIILIVLLSIMSILYFDTFNFIKCGIGLIKITFTDEKIVKISDSKEVYLSKSNDNPQELLIKFMESKGYIHLESERVSSMLVFEKDDDVVEVFFSVNRYYSKWVME